VAPFVGRALAKVTDSKIEIVGVFGNNDGERGGLHTILGKIMKIKGDFAEEEWDGIKIAIYHGTSHPLLNCIIESGRYDLVLCGHTHQVRMEHINNTVVVNPGETCGYLTGKATCAIIDLGLRPFCLESVTIREITLSRKSA